MVTSAVILQARGLRVAYAGGPDVLNAADAALTAGRRLAVLGGNGSGKTTLLRVLSGSLVPRSGEVLVEGQALRHTRRALTEHRRRVQLVLQDPSAQLFSADVFQDVAFGPLNLGLPPDEVRDRVTATLEMLSISDLADRPVHQLSFGQQKRVALAGAVAMRPEVLLLDEPTAGLDPQGTTELLRCLHELEAQGTTVALSTHDVALAWLWADDVAVVVDATVRQGSVTTILTSDDLLASARLEAPWQVRLLRGLGRPTGDEPRPRDVEAMLRVIGRTTSPDGGS